MKSFLFVALLIPSMSFAHGSKVEMANEATNVALKLFATNEQKTVTDAFNAVKTWLVGAEIKVKVYYNANLNTVDYTCQMDHSGNNDKVVCSK